MKRRINGEGCISKRKDRNSWEYRYIDKETKKRKAVSAKTRKELYLKIEKLNQKTNIKKRESRTLESLIIEEEKRKLNKNIISPATYRKNIASLKIIQNHYIGRMSIEKIELSDIEDFANSLITYSNSMIKKMFSILSRTFKNAINMDLITKNLLINYKTPKSLKTEKKVKALTMEEQKNVLQLIPQSKYYLQYLIAFNTGMRMGEINALKYSDIDLKNRIIHVNRTVTMDINYKAIISRTTKTSAGLRVVPINSILFKELDKVLKNNKENKEFLFLRNNKAPIDSSDVTRELKRLTKKRYSSHMIRHTFATRAIESGMPPVVLSRILGHRNISTTLNTYTDVFNQLKEEHIKNLEEYLSNFN